VTGCGAAALETELTQDGIRDILSPIEFEAWARGANEMLTRLGEPAIEPYLLVSIGTGTSILRVEGEQVERVGGTALGGGAALGLGLALTGVGSSQELNELALQGDRSSIDLMVSDIFENVEGVGAIIASGFGKLARNAALPESERETPRPADLASATIGIVADNIGLLVASHARSAGVSRIVFGGSTLITHPQIELTVRGIAALGGLESSVLPHPGHTGALGAMLMGRR
jgi:type II pantothenate kinase